MKYGYQCENCKRYWQEAYEGVQCIACGGTIRRLPFYVEIENYNGNPHTNI